MNGAIDAKLCSVKYPSFDSAVAMVANLGRRALLAICDNKSTFGLLLVHPRDFGLLGGLIQGCLRV